MAARPKRPEGELAASPIAPTRLGFVVAISAVAAIGGFLFGFDSGVINGTVDALQEAFGSTDVGVGFDVASVLLGCAVGALLAGVLADRWGRRPVMWVASILFTVSAWGSGYASGSLEFDLYRLLGGVAVGAASVLAPAYISEVAPSRLRGRLGTLQQLAIVIGLFAAFCSNYLLAGWAGSAREPFWYGIAAWRWMFWVEIVPAVLFLAGTLWIPESPRYLVLRGQLEAAARVFERVEPGSGSARVAEVAASVRGARRGTLSELLIPGRRQLLPVVWVGVGLSAFQQLVGINVVFYYGELLWKAAGFGEGQALMINVVGGATNIVSTFIALALVDRLGRRPLLLLGSAGMAMSLGVLGLVFQLTRGADGAPALGPATGTVALIAANAYIVCFAATWGPVVWVLLGEMFPNRIRGSALAVAASAQSIANFAVTMTFPWLLRSFGLGGAYGVYAVMAALSFFFVARAVSETRGRSLEEM